MRTTAARSVEFVPPTAICTRRVALSMTETYRGVDVNVRFKPVSGRVGQVGGIVFRYRDPDNYYVARANALEDNVRLGADLTVSPQTWHTLRVVCLGDRIDVYLDDQRVYQVGALPTPGGRTSARRPALCGGAVMPAGDRSMI